jgi:prolyl-tRNA synthetase
VDELDANLLLPFEEAELAEVPRARAQALDWRPPRDGSVVRPLALAGEQGGRFDMRRFSGWLRDAGVIDQGPIELSGATVTLPHGMRLMRRFDTIVRRIYEDYGYEEYDYPLLVPASVLEPTRKIMSLDNALLYAGDDDDWRENRKRMVLTPTGEGAVYTHWSKLVRGRADLPLRTYRRTRYFRPSRSGRSVFRAIEAMDVYEFQACFADRPAAQKGFDAGVAMARRLCAEMHIPVLWATRPPWTNNAGVSEVTIGGDVPLPHGSTIQVGSVYHQGQRFSQLYDVGYRDGADYHHTHHVTGALTRRLVLVNLMLGMSDDGELLLHPDLAPVQVALTLADGDEQERSGARALVARLAERGVRCDLRVVGDRKEVGRSQAQWRRQGVPLRVYLQPRRNPGDRTKAVVVRADTRHEAVLLTEDLSALADRLPAALDEVATGYRRRAWQFVRGQCRPADASTVRDVLAARAVAVAPLLATAETVTAVSSWGLGEVLGLRRTAEPGRCVVTGQPTFTSAYISPRR